MNQNKFSSLHADMDADAQDFALRVGAALKFTQDEALPHDISARLSIARSQALEAYRTAQAEQALAQGQTPGRAWAGLRWWQRALAITPFVAAGAGGMVMQGAISDDGTSATIQTDVQILASDVPPEAYADEGFLEYLKTYQKQRLDSLSGSQADNKP